MRALVFSCVACLMLVGAGPVAAQPAKPEVKVTVVRGKDGKKTYVFGKVVLYGKTHQPHTVLMLSRERDLYRAAVLKRTFTPHIPSALERSPF